MKLFLAPAALVAAFIAAPASATVTDVSHVGTPTTVRPGAAASLNTQPIPPGRALRPHAGTPTAVRAGAAASLNTQPIPPGHALVAGAQTENAPGREHTSVHKHHHKHKHAHAKAPVRGYDLKENQKV